MPDRDGLSSLTSRPDGVGGYGLGVLRQNRRFPQRDLVVLVVLVVRVAKAIRPGIRYYLARASRFLRLSGRLWPLITAIQKPRIWAILCENGATGGASLPP